MRYFITNGSDYIHVINKNGQNAYVKTDNISYANCFKKSRIDSILRKLDPDEHWGFRKIKNSKNGKNYVITNGTTYVSDDEKKISNDISKAKSFRSIADAETYMSKNKLFEDAVIIDDNGNKCDSGVKSFSKEQLDVLGLHDKKTKRISISKTIRDKVYEKGNGICALCGRHVTFHEFTIDHITPIARGGQNNIKNYQIACKTCNKLKADSKDKEFVKGISSIISYRMDNFSEEESNKELAYPVIRSFVRSIINNLYENERNVENVIE